MIRRGGGEITARFGITGGHSAQLIFLLAAMLTFCQIIRKLSVSENECFKCLHSHCNYVTDLLIKFRQDHISKVL